MSEIYDDIIRELTKPSERDKQRKVGPSELGDLCERCLAEKLLGVHDEEKTYPLAPMIGTAFHLYLETTLDLKDYLKETRVTVGTIEGYGNISGTADGFDVESGHVVDYKVLSKKKIKAFSSAAFFDESHNPEFYSDSMTEGRSRHGEQGLRGKPHFPDFVSQGCYDRICHNGNSRAVLQVQP